MTRRTIEITAVLSSFSMSALLFGCQTAASPDAPAPQAPAKLVSERATVASPEPVPVVVDRVSAKAAWKQGVGLFEQGEYASAASSLKTASDGEPGDAYRRYLLGLAQARSEDLAGAEASLAESARLDGSRVKTWINLARVRNGRGDRSGALTAADRALAIEPGSSDALHQKGRALMELGRTDEALATLTTAQAQDPKNGYLANTLGLLLIQLGRPGEAVAPLESARNALPHLAYVRNNLGVAYERTGRSADAKLEYLAAVEAGDTGGKAMKSLARLGAPDPAAKKSEPPVETASAQGQ